MSNTFLNSLNTNYHKKSILVAILIFLITFVLFASLSPNALLNGDAAMYENQIKDLNFDRVSTHLAYFLSGAVFVWFLPGPNDYVLNLMSCFFGALCISLIYLTALTVYRKHAIAIVSSLFLLLNNVFIINSLYAEVYVMQTFFFLLALLFWLLNKPIIAGVSFAIAFLVTPSTILAIPCLIILRPHKRALFLFGIALLVVLTLALLPRIDDYLFGNRGLLVATVRPLKIRNAIIKEGYEGVFGFFLAIPFLIIGIKSVFTHEKYRLFGFAIFCLWIVNFLFGERFSDVPVQLPLYALLCLIGGLGYNTVSTDQFSNGQGNRALIFVWSFSSISLVVIGILITAAKIEKTPTQISIPLIIIYIVAVALFAAVFTLLVRMMNINKFNNLLLALVLLILLCSMNSGLSITVIRSLNHDMGAYRNMVLEIKKKGSPNFRVIGDWNRGMLFEHYVFNEHNTGYWMNSECYFGYWGESKREEFMKEWRESLASHRELWLLEYYPNLISDLHDAGYSIQPFGNVYRAIVEN